MNRHDIEILGKEVARQLGDGPSPARIERQRNAVLARFEEMHFASRGRRGSGWRWALAGMALGMLAGILLWWRLAGVSLPATVPPDSGAPTSQEQVVRLPDGNEMRLAAGSQGSVKEASSRQVRLSLVRGKLTSVVRVPVRWCVEAGPYYVEAAGTEYTVRWDPPRLEVAVTKGRVTVSMEEGGPALWKLDAGSRLVVENGKVVETAGQPAPVVENAPVPAEPKMHPEGEPALPPQNQALPEEGKNPEKIAQGAPASSQPPRQGVRMETRETAPPRTVAPEDPPAPEWKRLLQAEDYRGAVAAMEQAGLATFADTAPLSDLQAMATAARYAGKPQTALVLLVSMRTRFPGTKAASVAAFLMGRVYAEQLGDHRAAVAWFSTYLGEVPDGVLAEEALGRRMDSAHRCGMDAQARESARQLLERFPSSPFATLARKITGK